LPMHIIFNICIPPSSTLHATQSGCAHLGAWHMPLGAFAMFKLFIKLVFGYLHKLHL
jgi:hypothetical protein